jgi:hypothetical protein
MISPQLLPGADSSEICLISEKGKTQETKKNGSLCSLSLEMDFYFAEGFLEAQFIKGLIMMQWGLA